MFYNNHQDSGSIKVMIVWLLIIENKSHTLQSCKSWNIMLHFKSKGLGWEMLIKFSQRYLVCSKNFDYDYGIPLHNSNFENIANKTLCVVSHTLRV